MGKTPKIPVLHIYHNQDGKAYNSNVREDKVYLQGEKVAQFSNRGVFTIKGLKLAKRSKLKCLIYLDGKAKTVKITSEEEKKKLIELAEANPDELQVIPETMEMLFEPLTDKDRVTVVKREIAKQLGKFKPMETWQFIVIIALLGASIALHFIV